MWSWENAAILGVKVDGRIRCTEGGTPSCEEFGLRWFLLLRTCPAQRRFGKLRALGGDVEDQSAGALASYDPEGVSIPGDGWKPVDLGDLWGTDGGENVGDYVQRQLLPADEARSRLKSCGLVRPYSDPKLRDPKTYGEFVRRLLRANIVEIGLEPGSEEIGIFFVSKKNGRLRLIIDARKSNCHFADPAHVQLVTGDGLGNIEVEEGVDLIICSADLKDAFYHLALPEALRPLFTLPGVDGRHLRGLTVGGQLAKPGVRYYPRLAVVPMGWSWALYICQKVHERLAQQAGLVDSDRLVDRRPAPSAQAMHAQYVDNLVVIGHDQEKVLGMYQRAVKVLKDSGLEVHEEEVNEQGATVLGWEFTRDGVFRPSRRRAWKTRLAIRALLARGRSSARQLEKVIGHCTFISLARRESLSVFGEVYRLIRRNYSHDKEVPMPRLVRAELQKWDGLLPLIYRRLGAKWSSTVHAVDASEWGLGVTTSHFEPEEAKSLGKYSERWRFKESLSSHARAQVFFDRETQSAEGEGLMVVQDSDVNASTSFVPPVPFSAVSRKWVTVGRHRWRRPITLPVGEARATLYAVKHALRSRESFGRKHLVLTDSMTAACALGRGRAHTFGLRRVCEQVGALSLCSGCSFHLRWIPSEYNPSDSPSRGGWVPSSPKQVPARRHGDIPRPREGRLAADEQATKDGEQTKGSGGRGSERGGRGDERCMSRSKPEGSEAEAKMRTGPPQQSRPQQDDPGAGRSVSAMPCKVQNVVGNDPTQDREIQRSPEGQGRSRERGVQSLGGDVYGRRRSGHGTLPGGCHNVLLCGAQGLRAAGTSKDQTESEWMAEASAGKKPATDTVRSGGPHQHLGHQKWTHPDSPPHSPIVHAVLEAVRRPEVAVPGCGEANAQEGGLLHVDVHPPSVRGRGAFKDTGVRRVAPAGPRLPQGDGGSAVEGAQPAGSGSRRQGLLRYDFRSERAAGVCEGCAQPWSPRSFAYVSTTARRSVPRLCQRFARLGKCTGARTLAGCSECETLPERSQAGAIVRKPQRRRAARVSDGHRRAGRAPPLPALNAPISDKPVFIEIFSGSGRLGRAISRFTNWYVLLWDVQYGPEYDLTLLHVQWKVLGWLRAGKIIGAHLGTPCRTFTRARDCRPGPPPLRSNDQPLGLRGLLLADQRRVDAANSLMKFTVRFMQLCTVLHVACTLENPATSRMWLCPPMCQLTRRKQVQHCVIEFCQFGAPWRRSTMFIGVHLSLHLIEHRRCLGSKRVCNRTHLPHIPAANQNARGRWMTTIAERYPHSLCRALAISFLNYQVSLVAENFQKRWNQ